MGKTVDGIQKWDGGVEGGVGGIDDLVELGGCN